MTDHTRAEAPADGPLFPLGQTVATPGAVEVLAVEGGDWRFNAAVYLARHQDGDWGDVPPEDARENELSVREGFRIVSSYEVGEKRIWIILKPTAPLRASCYPKSIETPERRASRPAPLDRLPA